MAMKQENELKSLLTGQQFEGSDNRKMLLARARECAHGYALTTEGIAVVSDFQCRECHIYSGKFGRTAMNLPEYMVDRSSAFEDIILSHIDKDDLIGRHILELRFFNLVKELPLKEKTDLAASCIIGLQPAGDGGKVRILHTTRYLGCSSNGSVLLGICTYTPYPVSHMRQDGIIVKLSTGETIGRDIYEASDRRILSRRQLEILSLLAGGMPSKQIADRLDISVHTVNRHRQDIIAALKVANTAAAVEIALRMNLI